MLRRRHIRKENKNATQTPSHFGYPSWGRHVSAFFSRGRQHLWETLRKQFGEGDENERFEVEEAILLGDITDRTLSSTSQIITHTNAFIQMLGDAADIKRGLFIPGNHEHTLWTEYHQRRDGNEKYYSVTRASGEPIVKKGERHDKNRSAEELLAIFFGHPSGSSWRRINDEKKLEFAIANPVYVKQLNGQTYVVTVQVFLSVG